jgi:hypothetical protein
MGARAPYIKKKWAVYVSRFPDIVSAVEIYKMLI